jgi:uncharacterized membrane protein YgcG
VRLVRLDKTDESLKRFEREILDGLFAEGDDVTLDSLETKFHETMSSVRTQVYKGLSKAGYFAGDLSVRRGLWIAAGILCAVFTIVVTAALVALGVFAPISTGIAGALTAVQFPIFAWFMPRKTARGRKALEHIKGLEEYLGRAELPILESAARRAHFEALLPYAMALNLSDVWARRFEDIYDRPPDWFDTDTTSALTAATLVHHVNLSSTTMTRSLSVAPRSEFSSGGFGGGSSGFSGGGFSGGGAGGGGGGGW